MPDYWENHCKDEFAEINRKLDNISESLNGNGKPGIKTRLDRVEQTIKAALWAVGITVVAVIGKLIKGE